MEHTSGIADRPFLAHLARRYPTARWTEFGLRVVFSCAGDTGGCVRIGVRVEPIRIQDKPWLQLVAELGPAQKVQPVVALEHNYALGVGALTIADDVFVLRAVLPEVAGQDALEQALALVVHEAARWKRTLRLVVPDGALFDAYSE